MGPLPPNGVAYQSAEIDIVARNEVTWEVAANVLLRAGAAASRNSLLLNLEFCPLSIVECGGKRSPHLGQYCKLNTHRRVACDSRLTTVDVRHARRKIADYAAPDLSDLAFGRMFWRPGFLSIFYL